jgi:predicted kinase
VSGGAAGGVLVALGGLPGTGKTTIGRILAEMTGALFLRIDTIEQALRVALGLGRDVGASGYAIAASVARDNLALGRRVVADAVNPVAASRALWRDAATEAGADLIEVEIVCSDAAEHRRRVETRAADLHGHRLPDWQAVLGRHYEPWESADLVLDTARIGPAEAAATIAARLSPADAR